MQEPGIRIILDADFDVDEHASSKQCGAMSESFLGDTQTCPEACEAKSLLPPQSVYIVYPALTLDPYRREERVVGEAR